MKDDEIYNSWNEFINSDQYKKYFLSHNEEWYNNLEQAKQYIDIKQKRPSTQDEIENIKSLGQWLSTQKKK